VLAGSLVVLGILVVRGLTEQQTFAASCEGSTSLRLVSTPELTSVLEAAAAELGDRKIDVGGGCLEIGVETSTAAELLQAVEKGAAELPELWVPDASTWLSELPRGDVPDSSAVRRFARTPVVLVGHEGAARPDTWLGAVSSAGTTITDPRTSAASVGTLAALHGETVSGATSGTDLASWLVSAAQGSDPRKSPSADDLYARAADASPDEPAFFPSTEQHFLERVDADPDLPVTAVVPRTGSTMLDYPLAALDDSAATSEAFTALGDYLESGAGAEALAAAGFRPPSGQAPEDSPGVAQVTELGQIDAIGIDRLLRQWVTLSVRTRMLAVIDVSGSMAESAGDKTRVQLATEAATASLQLMPDDAELGIWAFSIGIGENGRDYRELVPVRPLGASRGDTTHRKRVADGARSLPRLVGGGTGLYDSTLAAYRTAQAEFDPARSNSIVVLTDGENEDPGGLSLQQLLARLEQESDPASPIQIITIGMGPQADTAALQRISELTGAQNYVADDPRDIATIFTQALLERVGWGLR